MISQPSTHLASPVVKRSINLRGHRTAVSLEDAFWDELKAIATARKAKIGDLVYLIDVNREQGNLSSACRLFVLAELRRELGRST